MLLLRQIVLVQNIAKCSFPKNQVFAAAAAGMMSRRCISYIGRDSSVTKKRRDLTPICINDISARNKMTTTLSAAAPEKAQLIEVFPDLVRELIEVTKDYDENDVIAEWFAEALNYNIPNGRCLRSAMCIRAYNQLYNNSQNKVFGNYRSGCYLAWCVELFHCACLMFDDVMDSGIYRRGQVCWYRLEKVGMLSLNDALMVENSLYSILKKHFGQSENYIKLVELFRETMMISTVGQCIDCRATTLHVTDFNMEKYKTYAGYKTAYYSFYMPIAAPMILFGITNLKMHEHVKTILMDVGTFFQIANDYMDCFGDPKLTGKVASDVEENKCSWLAVKCMEKASDEQKAIMEECYGQKDSAKVARVKQLYEDLEIPKEFAHYQKESYENIKEKIGQLPLSVFRPVLLDISNSVYKNYDTV